MNTNTYIKTLRHRSVGSKLQFDASTAEADAAAARDRRRAAKDNIQKMLDIMRGMNPQL